MGNEVSLVPVFSDVETHSTHSVLTLFIGKEGEIKPRMSHKMLLDAQSDIVNYYPPILFPLTPRRAQLSENSTVVILVKHN